MEKQTTPTAARCPMLEAGESNVKVITYPDGSIRLELAARVELDNYPNGWSFVRPGHRPRRHRRELRAAKEIFGMSQRKDIWWLPVGYKKLDQWTIGLDYGLPLPEFIPLVDGEKTGDRVWELNTIVLPEHSPNGNACTATILILFRFSEDVGLKSADVPAYWEKGRRRKA